MHEGVQTVQSMKLYSSFIGGVLGQTASLFLSVLNQKSRLASRSSNVPNSSCMLVFAILYLYITIPPVCQQQFHFHTEANLADHALSDNQYTQNLASGSVFFEILVPEELQYTYKITPAAFSIPFNSTFRDPIALVMAEPTCGCGSLRNFEDIEGNIVLMERGECSFVSKTIRAQEAGAVAAIITDEDIENDELYISMVDDQTGRKVTIPSGFLLGKNGHYIRRTLERHKLDRAMIRIPVNISNVHITDINQPPWLIW